MRLNKTLLFLMFFSLRAFAQNDVKLTEKLILDPKNLKSVNSWRPINDTVMGGLSTSQIIRTKDNLLHFNGTISLKNNGGFASIRKVFPAEVSLKNYRGFRLKVKGDGRVYQLSIRETANFNGQSYNASFETEKDRWQIVELPFKNFISHFYGRNTGKRFDLDRQVLRELAVLLADKMDGSFQLDLAWIKMVN